MIPFNKIVVLGKRKKKKNYTHFIDKKTYRQPLSV